MSRTAASVLVSFVLAACGAGPQPPDGAAVVSEAPAGAEAAPPAIPSTAAEKIQNALSAAPQAIAAQAMVMDWPAADGGQMAELRPGANGWTCMPDIPGTPGNDPMCLDQTFLAWAGAWQAHTVPTIDRIGLAYMLQGGADASNTDPYATAPAAGEEWVKSGPHVMIAVPDPAMLATLPTDPGSGGPFVMWKGTPYAHIMMPVR